MRNYTIYLNNDTKPSDPTSITASGFNAIIDQGMLCVVTRDPEGRSSPQVVCAVPVANISHVESSSE